MGGQILIISPPLPAVLGYWQVMARAALPPVVSLGKSTITADHLAMQFYVDTGSWVILGNVAEGAETQEQQEILDALSSLGGKVSPNAIQEELGSGRSHDAIKQPMWWMLEKGPLIAAEGNMVGTMSYLLRTILLHKVVLPVTRHTTENVLDQAAAGPTPVSEHAESEAASRRPLGLYLLLQKQNPPSDITVSRAKTRHLVLRAINHERRLNRERNRRLRLNRAWRLGKGSFLSRCGTFIVLALTLLAVGADPGGRSLACHLPTLMRTFGQRGDATCGGAWVTFDFDASRSGVNPLETAITPTTVKRVHRLWVHRLPDVADSAPIVFPRLTFPDGTIRDVLYVTTKVGSLVALDARTGRQLWARTPLVPSDPNKMTTASPVGDVAQGVVYGYGMDGKVHRYRATTGQEITGGGWPIPVTRMKESEKASSALNAANGYLYVTTAGFAGDAPPYQGHVVVIDLATGATQVFNALCARRRHLLAPGECPENDAGMWARPGAVIDPLTGHVFVATGNGLYTANRGGDDWGGSVLELTPDGSRLLDAYTPTNADELVAQDQDLGSAAPALLPVIAGSRTPALAVQAGKEGVLRLLNRQNLSGKGGPGHMGGELQTIDAPDHCPVLTQPAVWTDARSGGLWVMVSSSCALGGYQVLTSRQGKTTLRAVWSVGVSATSPVVVRGVLYAATALGGIVALTPQTGRQLWSSADPAAGGTIGDVHWESPIVVGGRLYCSDEQGQISAFGL